jgi:uncharacterized protein (TIRG00374 family)
LKKKLVKALKFLIFLAVGVLLFWYLYKDQEIDVLILNLKGANYYWVLLSVFLGVLSHFSRALRWKMLVEPMGYRPSTFNVFSSVMVTYLANLLFPRLGEIARPAVIKKYENIPVAESFGTIVLERIFDLVMLLVLTVFVVLSQSDVIIDFLSKNSTIKDSIVGVNFSTYIIILVVLILLLLAAIIIFRRLFKHTIIYKKVQDIYSKFMGGFKSIRNIKNLPLFIFHTLFIWAMYYLMMYVCFFAFDFTSELGMVAALLVFVISSYGMVAPVPGGIGAWHFMVIGTLFVFGVSDDNAKAFALVAHSSQILMIIVVGVATLVALPIVNKRDKLKIE